MLRICQICVKGTNFVDLKDAGDPVEVAAMYDKSGADELVFLDITASSDGRNTTVELVRNVAEKVFIPFHGEQSVSVGFLRLLHLLVKKTCLRV